MTPTKAKKLSKKLLSKERFFHSKCVAEAAKNLALHFGEDVDKALICGYLHDIAKEFSEGDLLQMIECSDIITLDEISNCPLVWHAYAGGVYALNELGVSLDIASAIACHTSGKAGMNKLDMIVYLADYISKDRDFNDIDEIKEIVYASPMSQKTLPKAVLIVLERQIKHLLKHEKSIDLNTIRAYNCLLNTEKHT